MRNEKIQILFLQWAKTLSLLIPNYSLDWKKKRIPEVSLQLPRG